MIYLIICLLNFNLSSSLYFWIYRYLSLVKCFWFGKARRWSRKPPRNPPFAKVKANSMRSYRTRWPWNWTSNPRNFKKKKPLFKYNWWQRKASSKLATSFWSYPNMSTPIKLIFKSPNIFKSVRIRMPNSYLTSKLSIWMIASPWKAQNTAFNKIFLKMWANYSPSKIRSIPPPCIVASRDRDPNRHTVLLFKRAFIFNSKFKMKNPTTISTRASAIFILRNINNFKIKLIQIKNYNNKTPICNVWILNTNKTN